MTFLWKDRTTGKTSNSQFWKTVAYFTGTYVIIINASGLSAELLLVYLSIIGGSEIATRFIELKWGKTTDEEPTK